MPTERIIPLSIRKRALCPKITQANMKNVVRAFNATTCKERQVRRQILKHLLTSSEVGAIWVEGAGYVFRDLPDHSSALELIQNKNRRYILMSNNGLDIMRIIMRANPGSKNAYGNGRPVLTSIGYVKFGEVKRLELYRSIHKRLELIIKI